MKKEKEKKSKIQGRPIGVVTYIYNTLWPSKSSELKSLLLIMLEIIWHGQITA